MFSYWGNHGLADQPIIPLGSSKHIAQIDSFTYIEPENYKTESLEVKSFTKSNNYVVGKCVINTEEKPIQFFCWNLETDHVVFFISEEDYHTFATVNKLPKANSFITFEQYYEAYWLGWRFWLLP